MPAWYLKVTVLLERAGLWNYVPPAIFGFRSDGNRVGYQSSSRRRWIAMCTADDIKLAECLDRFTLQAHGST